MFNHPYDKPTYIYNKTWQPNKEIASQDNVLSNK